MKNYHNIRSSFENDNTVYTTNGVVQDLKELSNTHWLDAIGTRTGVQYEKYVYDFDGVNSKIDTNIFPPTLTGEVEMRIKITQEGTIFSNRNNSSNYFEVLGGNLNDSLITIDLKESPNHYVISSNFINDGDWHKINIRYTGFSLYIYIDDQLDKIESSLTLITSNLDKLFIGCRSNSSHFVTMQLAEFKWKSLQNIILIWYKCEEQLGTTAYDSSGYSNNGTLLGGITHTTTRNNKLINYTNLVGYSTLNNVIIPRDESNTDYDVLGNLLQNNGEVANNVKLINSNAIQVDTTTEAHLNFNAVTLMITSYGGTATPTLDVNNNKITFTDGIIYDLKLFDYAHGVQINFPLAEGSGSTSYSIDNGYTLTWINTHNWILQDEYHYNILNGFSTDNDVRLPFMHLKVEDYPLLWINQNYYYNYKDNIFKVPYQLDQSVWVGDQSDYDGVIAISLPINGNYTTDFTSTFLSKFSNLTNFTVQYNPITILDPSQNLSLLSIVANTTNVNNINLNQNINLVTLQLQNTGLTSINVNNNINLENLLINGNNLSSINVTNNTLLTNLTVQANPNLSSLDLSQNSLLERLYAYNCNFNSIDVSSNPLMSNLRVQNNLLNSTANEKILTDLDSNNYVGGYFQSSIYGGGNLSHEGVSSGLNLLDKNWTIVGLPLNYLLNDYSGAAAAYSLYRLNTAYTGPAITVRRDSDNSVQDIGFVNGILDTAALTTFCTQDVDIYTSDFSAGGDILTQISVISTNGETIGGVSDAYKIETTSTGSPILHQVIKGSQNENSDFTVSFDYYIPSTNTVVDQIQVGFVGGTGTTYVSGLNSWNSVTLNLSTVASGNLFFRPSVGANIVFDAAGELFYLKNIVITQTSDANGLVTKWYDQSGNGIDATQSTASQQPKIFDSVNGIITENGKPAIDATGIFIALRANFSSSTVMTAIAVSRITDGSSNRYIIDSSTGRFIIGSFSGTGKYTAFRSIQLSGDDLDTFKAALHFAKFDGANSELTTNSGTTYTGNAGTSTFTEFRIGSGLGGFKGTLQEIIVYPNDQSTNRLPIMNNINDRYELYWSGATQRLLDTYTGAAAAYSLEAINAGYTGNIIQVRRDSDNAVLDIGANYDGSLDVDKLTNFCNTPVNKYTSDFSSTENLFEVNGIGSAAETVGGVSDAYKFTLTGGANQHFTGLNNFVATGANITVTFDYYIPSTNAKVNSIAAYSGNPSFSFIVLDNWTSVSITMNLNQDDFFIFAREAGSPVSTLDADGDVFYLKNIVVTQNTSNGYVPVWYDQSGLGNDAIQSVASDQPKIYDSVNGIVLQNGKPSIDFSDKGHLETVDTGIDTLIEQIQIVAYNKSQITTTSSLQQLLATYGSAGFEGLAVGGSTGALTNETFTILNNGAAREAITDVINIGSHLFTVDWNGNNHNIYLDSNEGSFISVNTPVQLNSRRLLINGRFGSSIFYFNGYIQEIIMYDSDQSTNRVAIQDNINNRYFIYLKPLTTYNVEDYPLIWINGLYYNTFKDDTFEVSAVTNNTTQAEYDAVTIIYLDIQNLTTDFTSNFLEKFENLNVLNIANNNISNVELKNNLLTECTAHDNNITFFNCANAPLLEQLRLYNNQLTVLDVSNNTNLSLLFAYNNNLSSLDVSNNALLTNLSIALNSLASLDLSNNALLADLRVNNNNLTSLDVSNNVSLTRIDCQSNSISSLDISNNVLLEHLRCDAPNGLTSLDVSNNPLITYLYCAFNRLNNLVNSQILIDLDTNGLSNGYLNSTIFGTGFITPTGIDSFNALLSKSWNIVGLTNQISAGSTYNVEDFPKIWIDNLYYNTYKDNTFVPSVDTLMTGQVEYDTVTSIFLNIKSLTTDFTGTLLGKFNNLSNLQCVSNQISVLDVSQNTNLTQLICYGNKIQTLDVSQLVNLNRLECKSNRLDAATNSQLLIDLDTNGQSNGILNSSIFGGGTLTAAGQTAKTNLLSKGWTIVGI